MVKLFSNSIKNDGHRVILANFRQIPKDPYLADRLDCESLVTVILGWSQYNGDSQLLPTDVDATIHFSNFKALKLGADDWQYTAYLNQDYCCQTYRNGQIFLSGTNEYVGWKVWSEQIHPTVNRQSIDWMLQSGLHTLQGNDPTKNVIPEIKQSILEFYKFTTN